MLSPDEVVEIAFLEARHQLLEVAALLDRHDAAVARHARPAGPAATAKLAALDAALAALRSDGRRQDRTVALLELFAKV